MTKKTKPKPSSADPVTAYARDVKNGLIAAGPYVRGACDRHLQDLRKGKSRGLFFDKDAAQRAIDFFRVILTVEKKNETVPFILEAWQAFIIGSIFGWMKYPTRITAKTKIDPAKASRRFRTCYIESGKGSGKSPLAAGVGMYCFVSDGVASAEVYAAATKKDQAMILFRDAVAMRNNSQHLRSRIGTSGRNPVWQMYHTPTASFFKPISKDNSQSGPRPNCALVDEYHEHKSDETLGMLQAGFKGRLNPILFIITNSGSDKNTPCGAMHDWAGKVSLGEYEKTDLSAADEIFSYVCALDKDDDPLNNEECWPKANPNLGVTIDHDYLRAAVAQAKAMPAMQNRILRLNFCQWTDAADAWITRGAWEAVEVPADDWSKFEGREAYCGLDLSFTTDMSALATVFPDDKGGYDAYVDFWRPGEDLLIACDRDKVRYDLWAKDGFIELTEGKVIKLLPIARRMQEVADTFDLQATAFDEYRHKELVYEIEDAGIGADLMMMEHPQGFRRNRKNPLWMPDSCQELENAIIEGRLRVRVNPCLRWNVSSAVVREDPAGTDNWIFDKRRATGRIDGLAALAMAIGAAKAGAAGRRVVSPWADPSFSLQDA